MKATINLPDDLMLRAKRAASVAHVSLSEFIADSIHLRFRGRHRKPSWKKFRVITSGKGGVYPGVNLDDTSSLLDIMDGIKKD